MTNNTEITTITVCARCNILTSDGLCSACVEIIDAECTAADAAEEAWARNAVDHGEELNWLECDIELLRVPAGPDDPF